MAFLQSTTWIPGQTFLLTLPRTSPTACQVSPRVRKSGLNILHLHGLLPRSFAALTTSRLCFITSDQVQAERSTGQAHNIRNRVTAYNQLTQYSDVLAIGNPTIPSLSTKLMIELLPNRYLEAWSPITAGWRGFTSLARLLTLLPVLGAHRTHRSPAFGPSGMNVQVSAAQYLLKFKHALSAHKQ